MSNEKVVADVRTITRAVRAADELHQTVGGGTRHWVRECLLPALEDEGLEIVPSAARAEGEAEGYARAADEIATFVFDECALESGKELVIAAAIRAKFGGK